MELSPADLIPARELASLELIRVAAATVPSKLANALVKQLCLASPLPPSLKHVKRVRKSGTQPAGPASKMATGEEVVGNSNGGGKGGGESLDIILCCFPEHDDGPCNTDDNQSFGQETVNESLEARIISMLPDQVASIVSDHQLAPFAVLVPGNAPETREHWTEWCKVWPVSWRVPELGPGSAAAVPLTAHDQAYFDRMMKLVLTTSLSSAPADGRCPSSHPVKITDTGDSRLDAISNVALIVDPCNGQVLASSSAPSGENGTYRHHPLLAHAALRAIDAAAVRDRALWPTGEGYESSEAHKEGGAATDCADEIYRRSSTKDTLTSVIPSGKRQRVLDDSGTLVPLEASSASESNTSSEVQGIGSASAAKARIKESAVVSSTIPARPYLCTGYDCFLLREPCIMCAMALVHSRVSRVIFCQRDEAHGALGGIERLHSHRSLNHHYLVYHMPLKGNGTLSMK